MNSQRLAKLRISPLHLQQGLFATLALMITLIAVQQFNHWNQSHQTAQIQPIYTHSAPFAKASALKATDVALSFQTVEDGAVATDETPRRQGWVF